MVQVTILHSGFCLTLPALLGRTGLISCRDWLISGRSPWYLFLLWRGTFGFPPFGLINLWTRRSLRLGLWTLSTTGRVTIALVLAALVLALDVLVVVKLQIFDQPPVAEEGLDGIGKKHWFCNMGPGLDKKYSWKEVVLSMLEVGDLGN